MTAIDEEIRGETYRELKQAGHIFFYNQWNGLVIGDKVRSCFTAMDLKEVKRIKRGNEVWRDLEPYHPNGKVYGYSRLIITAKDGSMLEYDGVGVSGSFSGDFGTTFKLTDPKKLERLLGQYGSRMTDPFSEEQRESLRVFEQEWDRRGLPR